MSTQLKIIFGMKLIVDSLNSELWNSDLSLQRLKQNFEKGRIAHAYLFQGTDDIALGRAVEEFAGALLDVEGHVQIAQHPDLFALRPANKMRQISAEVTRELIRNVNQSPLKARRKVAIVYDVDRMHISAANAFLKTLEEPPADTIILLTTTRPYRLLPTIRSRCFHIRLPQQVEAITHLEWRDWLDAYQLWLEKVENKPSRKEQIGDYIFSTYGLICGFAQVLENISKEQLKLAKEQISEHWTEEEVIAFETGLSKGIRTKLFREIAQATHTFAKHSNANDHARKKILPLVIKELECVVGLLEVNFNEENALECFLMKSLKLWSWALPKPGSGTS